MIMKANKEFMLEAIEQAKKCQAKEYPIGAVVVRNNQIFARGQSLSFVNKDPTDHAEMVAIREAARKLGFLYLEGCVLYSTLEPCAMCAGAAVWAKMKGIVFGATMEDAIEYSRNIKDKDVSLSYRQILIKCKDVLDKAQPRINLVGGFMRDECKRLFLLSE